ncbi:hypothetical protein BRC73_05890, partial [Halobacteriales archaeon QH_7_66_37]
QDGSINAYTWSGGSGDTLPITFVNVSEEPFFDVNVTDTNSPVREGETLTVDVNVTNTGSETDTQTIDLNVDNDQDGSFDINADEETDVELDPGESRSVTLTYTTQTGDAPEIDFEVLSDDDREERTVTVNAPAFFDVNVTDTNSPVTEGETLEVDVNVTNTGDNPDTQTLNLTDTGFTSAEQDTVDVSLAPGAYNNSITLEWSTSDGDAGTGNVTVFSENTSDAAAVTVQEPPFFDVTIDSVEDSVTAGDTVTVEYTVENTGDLQDTQDIVFEVNGSQETVESDVTLDGGNTFSDQFTYTTDSSDTPAIEAAISSDNDTASAVVSVEEAPFFAVAITGTNSPVTEGETLTVDVNVTNTGTQTDTQTLNLTDTGFTNAEQDNVTVTLAGGESDDSITLEWPTSDGDTGTGDVTIFSENDSDLTEVTVEEASGLSGTSVTDIVPNASEQMQTFTFTISGEDLPSGEKIVVDLDEPQATSSIKVDYSSASVNDVNDESSGGDASINTNSGIGTLNYTASSGDVPAGTTVRIRVTSINAGGKSDQSDPYAIPISRTDFGVKDSTRFSVTPQNGTAELEDFEVTDLVGFNEQEQTIRFTPTTDMEATGNGPEILTVDLSKAQDGTVDYSSASVQSTSTGSAGVNTDSNVAYLKFEADGGVTAGTEVEITIESVNPSSTGETYETGFSRGAADTNSTTFDVCLFSCLFPEIGGRERVQYRHTQSVIREFRPPSVDSSSIHTPRETYKSNIGCCFQPSQWLRQDIYGAKHTWESLPLESHDSWSAAREPTVHATWSRK